MGDVRDSAGRPPVNAAGRDARVRVGPLRAIPVVLSGLGCDPEAVFQQAGFTLAQFREPENEIPFVSGSRLMARCVAATGCECFGLLVGKYVNSSSLGVAGFGARFAPDVRTAVQALCRFLELHDQGGSATLTVQGNTAYFGYTVHEPGVAAVDQIHDMSIAVITNIMREFLGEGWRPSRIYLTRPRPLDVAPYKTMLRGPVEFGAIRNAIAFPADLLNEVPISSDQLLFEHLEKEAEDQLQHRVKDFLARCRRTLRAGLLDRDLGAHEVAARLGIHERTLNRRLRERGTTFRQELETVRFEVARRLLSDPDRSLSEVALSLNYADSSSFCRAFKRWSGHSPKVWRQRQSM